MIMVNNLKTSEKQLVIALAKGRILKDSLPLFARLGITPCEDIDKSRKLMIQTNRPDIAFLIVRTTDVPTYVQYGAADLGIAGKDSLIEHGYQGFYELLDLNIARCRLMTAVENHVMALPQKRLTVATKYVKITQQYFADKGIHADIIKLYGSMELAPLVGLSDCIVDLVDSGKTLKENGLKPLDEVLQISSRLIVNHVALKTKHADIKPLLTALKSVIPAA